MEGLYIKRHGHVRNNWEGENTEMVKTRRRGSAGAAASPPCRPSSRSAATRQESSGGRSVRSDGPGACNLFFEIMRHVICNYGLLKKV